jgi:4-cresol dehydrogenase (hydroxylating)
MTASSVQACLEEWREALGPDAVTCDDAVLDRYARTTQPRGTRPCCVLYPTSTAQVQAVVRAASRHGVVVYPISRGKNWGYGDACAPTEDAAIVDLSRMDRVLEVDAELGCAVIEPGVSQQQLCDEVRRRAPGFWVDCTGAGPKASVAGNALERGFGHTPYGDHVRTTCGLEVVLADGRVLHTGFGHVAGARTASVYPYGVGPVLDGLFTQSNLGIVTRLGVWLFPEPEAFKFFYIGVEREDGLERLIDVLRPLRLRGILNSAVHVGNDLRIISSLRRYPWDYTGGQVPLPGDVLARLRRETGVAAWNISGSLTGTRAQVRAAARTLRRAAGSVGRVVFVGDWKLAVGQRVVRLLQKFGWADVLARQLEGLVPNYGLLKGIPTDAPLLGTHWRLRDPKSGATSDPLDAGSGLLWMAPVLPLRGSDARRLLDGVTPIFRKHGFDLPVTFTLLNERSMVAVLNVAFDKALPAECAAAAACYEEVIGTVKALGYPPYRSSVLGMPMLAEAGDTFWEVAQDIKRALDPGDILARGRYIPPLSR